MLTRKQFKDITAKQHKKDLYRDACTLVEQMWLPCLLARNTGKNNILWFYVLGQY